MRLRGFSTPNHPAGRVEVFYSGKWGTVCDDGWDIDDATVACRELGFHSAIKALKGSEVPDGTGQIWLDKVACLGSEKTLNDCSHNGWGNKNCGHNRDAGVQCSLTGTVKIFSIYIRL
jgi:deleted-in-malignant-brain-tumors protein 1